MNDYIKQLEGKTVFLSPTGNNARYTKTKIFEAEIIKVARVFVTVKLSGRRSEEKYRMSEHDIRHLDSGHNSGYRIYETLREFEDQIEVKKYANAISEKYKYAYQYATLDLTTIKKVAALLSVDIGEA